MGSLPLSGGVFFCRWLIIIIFVRSTCKSTIMDISDLGNQSQQKIDYQFIVVSDKRFKPVARSLHNQAVTKRIKSTTWTKDIYTKQESGLTNYNHIVFLSDVLIKENLANPKIQSKEIIPGVLYKHEGNSIGIFLDPKKDYEEVAKQVGNSLKEDWLYEVGVMIASGLIGVGIYSTARFFSKKKKAKIYLAFRAIDKFSESLLKDFVSDKLE